MTDGGARRPPQRLVELTIDGEPVWVPEGASLLEACRARGAAPPALCCLDGLAPANACRACVVGVGGSRALVASCSRRVEEGMVVDASSERVRHSRRLVLELLASAVDLSAAEPEIRGWLEEYGAAPERYGPPAEPRDPGAAPPHPGRHDPPDPERAATQAQPVRIDNELYVRDFSKCILCYRCVEACGEGAQHTFAIAVAGRGFDATIAAEYDAALPDSDCVFCGNCIGVCPTGALMFRSELELREAGRWDESRQAVTATVCPYCGVGCTLELHVQDNEIVKVTSPADHGVAGGHLCIKGRFGFRHVQARGEGAA